MDLGNYNCVRCQRTETDYWGWMEDDDIFLCLRCRDQHFHKQVFKWLMNKLPFLLAQLILSFVRRQPFRELNRVRLTRILNGAPWTHNAIWNCRQQMEAQFGSLGLRRGAGGRRYLLGCAHLRHANIDLIAYILTFLIDHNNNGDTLPSEWNHQDRITDPAAMQPMPSHSSSSSAGAWYRTPAIRGRGPGVQFRQMDLGPAPQEWLNMGWIDYSVNRRKPFSGESPWYGSRNYSEAE